MLLNTATDCQHRHASLEGDSLPDHLDTVRKAIEDQLAGLRQELQRLEAAHAALNGGGARRGRGRPRGSSGTTGSNASTRPRRDGSGPTRADQAHELVRANPGVTIPELAERMGINATYLYRVLPTLQKEKKITKRGKGWHASPSS